MAVESAQQNFLLKPFANVEFIGFDDDEDLDDEDEGLPEGMWQTIGTVAW